ncbi:MAG: zinc ribbon domain-containing protein [Natronomonas sp.]
MGDRACKRRFCPACDAPATDLDERCPECGEPLAG